MNAILTLGAVYAAAGHRLEHSRQSLSQQGAVDRGGDGSRFYRPVVLLSTKGPGKSVSILLLSCRCWFSPCSLFAVADLLTFTLHSLSFSRWSGQSVPGPDGMHLRKSGETLLLMLIFMGWVTWAGTSLGGLLQNAGGRLRQMNDKLTQNQLLLEQRIAERTQELQESQAQLVQQEKHAAFGLLAAGIAHEVGNPLAAISSLVQMLNRRPTDEYTREKLSLVDDQLRRIQRTLRELVDFSRPATTQKSKCDIHEIIDAALNIAKYYKRKKGKKIVTRYAAGIPLLRAARDQLVQILLNLILNAMDATDEGGTIEISTQLKDGTIEVAISDDGHGISAENQQRIFQPYFTTKETGTGLGLFVCRGIIEQAGEGRIELRKSSSAGTTFVVYVTCEVVRAHPDVLESEAVRTEMTTP